MQNHATAMSGRPRRSWAAPMTWNVSALSCGPSAALRSDGSIHSFLSHPKLDLEGVRLLATSLMLNGIAMEVCGSSRPASGSEHLISHALDASSARPRLHGLQVGVATYLMSLKRLLETGAGEPSPDDVRVSNWH